VFERFQNAIKAQSPIAPIQDQAEIQTSYRHYRVQMMVSMMSGYAAF
jgi:sugar phosphate permease